MKRLIGLVAAVLLVGLAVPAAIQAQGIGSLEYYFGYGKPALEAKKYPEAETYFRSAVDRAPDSAEAHFLLGAALLGQGLTAQGRAEVDKAVALDPSFKAREGELPAPPAARPAATARPSAPAARPSSPSTPAPKAAAASGPAPSAKAKAKSSPAPKASAGLQRCDDLYGSCYATSQTCSFNTGCQVDFMKRNACSVERNLCYRRNGG